MFNKSLVADKVPAERFQRSRTGGTKCQNSFVIGFRKGSFTKTKNENSYSFGVNTETHNCNIPNTCIERN